MRLFEHVLHGRDGEQTSDEDEGGHLLFAMAMRAPLTACELKSTLFAYPTGGSDLSYML